MALSCRWRSRPQHQKQKLKRSPTEVLTRARYDAGWLRWCLSTFGCGLAAELVVKSTANDLNVELAGIVQCRCPASGPFQAGSGNRIETREQIFGPKAPVVGHGVFIAGTNSPTHLRFGERSSFRAATDIKEVLRESSMHHSYAAGDIKQVAIHRP